MRTDTKELAEKASTLANYGPSDRPIRLIENAIRQGRAATLETLVVFAIAEHDSLGSENARRLFNLRWVTACKKLGVECPSDLELARADGAAVSP